MLGSEEVVICGTKRLILDKPTNARSIDNMTCLKRDHCWEVIMLYISLAKLEGMNVGAFMALFTLARSLANGQLVHISVV